MKGRCYWCGKPATTTRQIEPKKTKRDGTLVRRAVEVEVCPAHSRMIDRNVRARDLRQLIARRRRDLLRIQTPDDRRALEADLAVLERDLANLEASAA
jgi:hypothetical protein